MEMQLWKNVEDDAVEIIIMFSSCLPLFYTILSEKYCGFSTLQQQHEQPKWATLAFSTRRNSDSLIVSYSSLLEKLLL